MVLKLHWRHWYEGVYNIYGQRSTSHLEIDVCVHAYELCVWSVVSSSFVTRGIAACTWYVLFHSSVHLEVVRAVNIPGL